LNDPDVETLEDVGAAVEKARCLWVILAILDDDPILVVADHK
jgi:hypothetical protein